jgi:hypothetical protein
VWSAQDRSASGWSALIAAAPDAAYRLVRPDWQLVGPDGRSPKDQADAEAHAARGHSFASFIMHPNVGTINDRSELRCTLPPGPSPRTLSMRVALLDQSVGISDGVTVSVELARPNVGDAATGTPLAQESVTNDRIAKERGWIVVQAVIPPLADASACRVIVRPGPAANFDADWCCITPPVLSQGARSSPQAPAN